MSFLQVLTNFIFRLTPVYVFTAQTQNIFEGTKDVREFSKCFFLFYSKLELKQISKWWNNLLSGNHRALPFLQ